jgi:hypothetical protein
MKMNCSFDSRIIRRAVSAIAIDGASDACTDTPAIATNSY